MAENDSLSWAHPPIWSNFHYLKKQFQNQMAYLQCLSYKVTRENNRDFEEYEAYFTLGALFKKNN